MGMKATSSSRVLVSASRPAIVAAEMLLAEQFNIFLMLISCFNIPAV
jgi:hypothetical protein